MQRSDIESRIKELFVERLGLDVPPASIRSDSSLIRSYGLDSASVLAMVTSLEEDFDIEIDDDEFRGETFESVSSIARLVQSKLG